MSRLPQPTLSLQANFASDLPELAIPWQAEEAPEPRLLVVNEPLAAELGLDPEGLRSRDGIGLLTGHRVPENASPVAQAYAGHQFGSYVPRLGDGRALLLGEVEDTGGQRRDLHLKGSGRTPFARGGDGRAAVGPMLREYLVSEAMHALRIPTTRSLAVVATGRTVLREDGPLPGAVLARVASSHLRVGSFQYARSLDDPDVLRRLADQAIRIHYPEAARDEQPYLSLFRRVAAAQAALVARWLLVGFVHGVMNTDNMTISGETIDYGPCAFMDVFDPRAVYSSIDRGGRYAYGQQPAIAQWNLARFAEALLPLLHEDQDQAVALATEELNGFTREFGTAYAAGFRRKLGLAPDVPDGAAGPLIDDLLALLQQDHIDYTQFFRRLGHAARGDLSPVQAVFTDRPAFDAWTERWLAFGPDPAAMDRENPAYIPRNHLVEDALSAASADDLGPLERLLEVLQDPFSERPGLERYAEGPPEDFGRYTTFCGT